MCFKEHNKIKGEYKIKASHNIDLDQQIHQCKNKIRDLKSTKDRQAKELKDLNKDLDWQANEIKDLNKEMDRQKKQTQFRIRQL